MKQYRKRIYEASGNELAAVLKEIQERMEQEFNVESMVLLFTELSSLLNEKEESPDILQLIVFLAMQNVVLCRSTCLDLEKKFIRCIMTVFAFYDIVCVFSCIQSS